MSHEQQIVSPQELEVFRTMPVPEVLAVAEDQIDRIIGAADPSNLYEFSANTVPGLFVSDVATYTDRGKEGLWLTEGGQVGKVSLEGTVVYVAATFVPENVQKTLERPTDMGIVWVRGDRTAQSFIGSQFTGEVDTDRHAMSRHVVPLLVNGVPIDRTGITLPVQVSASDVRIPRPARSNLN